VTDRYGIAHDGNEFKVSRNAGMTVGVYKTEREAEQEIAACEQDDLILETARSLVKKAVDGLMRMHRIDRQTAHSWVRVAADQHNRRTFV
jgi:hypothetical protein